MDKIICLVGESGSGKSTLAELLEKESYNYIESYTTRKARYEGERGHKFITIVEYIDYAMENNFEKNCIAYTYYNDEHYFATRQQYQGKGTSIYIIDPAGIKDLKENVKDAEIVVIYLKVDEDTRFERMWDRANELNTMDERCKARKKVKERLEHDKTAFRIIQTDYVVDANRSIEEVLKDVKGIIEGDK